MSAGRIREYHKAIPAVVLCFAAACGDVTPPDTTAAAVRITADVSTLAYPDGETMLTAVVTNSAGQVVTGKQVDWLSSRTLVMSVRPGIGMKATVKATGVGRATITAAVDGKSASIELASVLPDTAPVRLLPDTSHIPVGFTRQLGVYYTDQFTTKTVPGGVWASSDPSVVAVDATGVIRAVGLGEATVTVDVGRSDKLSARISTFSYPAPLSFVTLATGSTHACALTGDGTAYCWGSNSYGQLGTTEETDRCMRFAVSHGRMNFKRNWPCSETPVPVAGAHRFASISTDGATTCALDSQGAAYCWGSNFAGATGTGRVDSVVAIPTPVQGGIAFKTIDVGDLTVCGISLADEAYCWGYNLSGQVGNGTRSDSPVPVKVAGNLSWRSIRAGGTTCGIATDDYAYCWGYNAGGQVNVASPTVTLTPTRASERRFASVQSRSWRTCGLEAVTAQVWCWGSTGFVGASSDEVMVRTPVPLTRLIRRPPYLEACGVNGAIGTLYCWDVTTNGASAPNVSEPVGEIGFSSSFACFRTSQVYCWDLPIDIGRPPASGLWWAYGYGLDSGPVIGSQQLKLIFGQ